MTGLVSGRRRSDQLLIRTKRRLFTAEYIREK
jgi:hypothetical protein